MRNELKMKEKSLYPIIKRYLEKKGYVCNSNTERGREVPFTNTGVNQVIMDVFGIKRTSNDRSNFDLEIIGVEVKPYKWEGPIPIKAMYQALSYARLAHRCYLAVPMQTIIEKDKINAADLGIGLMRIKGKSVEIVTYARRMEPNIDFMNQLLSKFWIVKCGLCSCYKYRYSKEEDGGGSWRNDLFYKKHSKWIWICGECENKLATISRGKITNDIWDKIYDLQKRVNKKISKKLSKNQSEIIWRELERIKKRIKRERESDDDYYLYEIERLDKKVKKLNKKLSRIY